MKRAQARLLMIAVLFVVILLILIGVFRGILHTSEEAAEALECRTSVESMAKQVRKGAIVIDELNCPTQEVTLSWRNEDNLKYQLSRLGLECMQQFAIDNNQVPSLFSDEAVYCVICHHIRFDKKITLHNFGDYLFSTPITKADQGGIPYYEGKTYGQIVGGWRTTEALDVSELKNPAYSSYLTRPIDTSKEFATIFVYAQGRTALNTFIEITGGIVFWPSKMIASALSGRQEVTFTGRPEFRAKVIYKEYSSDAQAMQDLRNLGCQIFPAKQQTE